jgi:hypothetical protein
VPGGLDAGRLREHLAEQGVLLDPVLPDGG